jgi:hypothetical protein
LGVLGVLALFCLMGASAVVASHKLPNGYSPFAYPGAPAVGQADPTATAVPAPPPTPAPAAGLTLDRFALGFGLIIVGTLGVGLAVLGLRRARRLRDAALTGREPPVRRP